MKERNNSNYDSEEILPYDTLQMKPPTMYEKVKAAQKIEEQIAELNKQKEALLNW